MLKNPLIIECYNKETKNWIRVNMQYIEPNDIIRFLNEDKIATDKNGFTQFKVKEIPVIVMEGGDYYE